LVVVLQPMGYPIEGEQQPEAIPDEAGVDVVKRRLVSAGLKGLIALPFFGACSAKQVVQVRYETKPVYVADPSTINEDGSYHLQMSGGMLFDQHLPSTSLLVGLFFYFNQDYASGALDMGMRFSTTGHLRLLVTKINASGEEENPPPYLNWSYPINPPGKEPIVIKHPIAYWEIGDTYKLRFGIDQDPDGGYEDMRAYLFTLSKTPIGKVEGIYLSTETVDQDTYPTRRY